MDQALIVSHAVKERNKWKLEEKKAVTFLKKSNQKTFMSWGRWHHLVFNRLQRRRLKTR